VKRPLLAAATVAAAVTLSSCGAAQSTDTAADVNGQEITVDQFEAVLEPIAANADAMQLDVNPTTQTIAGDTARQLLTVLVRREINAEFLTLNDQQITAADRTSFLSGVAQDDPALKLPQDVIDVLVDDSVATTARQRITTPDDLQQRYEASPADTGLFCVRHVLLPTEAAADAVVAELAGGAAFADVAKERSTEPAAKTTGGALEAQGQACMSTAQARQTFDATFVDAAVTAKPGTLVGPVKTDFGWHVIEARPWSEVADSATALFKAQAGELLYVAYATGLPVRIDPRYGRWDPATLSVAALQPAAP
jgi:parvulin-like peptidyl-prolyl isomerase